MLYNIYYYNVFSPDRETPCIQEKSKDFENFREATLYAATRCIDSQFEWEHRIGRVEDYIDLAHRNPYLIEKGIDSKLMDAIGRKQYCINTTVDMWFYAVPVEDDDLIKEAFENGTL